MEDPNATPAGLLQPAMSPHKRGDIQLLEGIQRAYTKQIRDMTDLSYWDRLKELGLCSQQQRKDRYWVIYMWKILEGQVPNPAPLALQPYTTEKTGRKCLRQSLPIWAPEKIRTLLASSLTYEGPKTFNALPKEVRSITGCLFPTSLVSTSSCWRCQMKPQCWAILPHAGPTTPYRIKWTLQIGTPGSGEAVDHHDCEEVLNTIPRIAPVILPPSPNPPELQRVPGGSFDTPTVQWWSYWALH